jgi:hypothetical protein
MRAALDRVIIRTRLTKPFEDKARINEQIHPTAQGPGESGYPELSQLGL